MSGSKYQSIPDEGDVAAAAEKLRLSRLADAARRGKDNAIAAGRDDGTGKSPGEGDPVEKDKGGSKDKGVAEVEKKAPGKAGPTKHAR